ncbi:alkaline-phosphatase-like protein [Pelagophyceae sp. CCMP2097]|nr:alkaline-phosphatase-like protein [Pelagophyceae sp. CCMP2097]
MHALASESLRLTDFHSPACTCTPSRAGLLTGRFASRYGMTRVILHDKPGIGLPRSEKTLPELLKRHGGYATAMAGKWHLGNDSPHHPTHHGFDEALSMPYSHDMACFDRWPCRYDKSVFDDAVSHAPGGVKASFSQAMFDMCKRGAAPSMGPDWMSGASRMSAHEACPPSQLSRCPPQSPARKSLEANCGSGCKAAEQRFTTIAKKAGVAGHLLSYALHWTNASCAGRTTCDAVTMEQPAIPWRLGEKLVAFAEGWVKRITSGSAFPPSEAQVEQGRAYRPFFLYVATHSPHLPYVPAQRWQRRPPRPGMPFAGYLDTMSEVDETVGGVLDSVESVRNDTILFLTSDNGPFQKGAVNYRTGSLGSYTKGGKFTPYEGGHRVFGLVRWPGRIEPGVSSRLSSHLDILPTLMSWVAPHALPRELDGRDLSETLLDPVKRDARDDDTLLILAGSSFPAIRVGKYKVWRGGGGWPGGGLVYDIDADPAESKPLSGVPREIMNGLRGKAEAAFKVYQASLRRDSAVSKETSGKAWTCCNPNLPDCHCPFPHNGLHLIRTTSPHVVHNPRRIGGNDDRCHRRALKILSLDVPWPIENKTRHDNSTRHARANS